MKLPKSFVVFGPESQAGNECSSLPSESNTQDLRERTHPARRRRAPADYVLGRRGMYLKASTSPRSLCN